MFLVVDLDYYNLCKYTNTKAKYFKTNLRLCEPFFVITKKNIYRTIHIRVIIRIQKILGESYHNKETLLFKFPINAKPYYCIF